MRQNRRIIHILIILCALFFSLACYMMYFQLFKSEKVTASAFNRRNRVIEDNTLRGTIFDKRGVVLAASKKTGKKQERIYPYGPLYSQVIGYHSLIYGKILLESTFDDYLLNKNSTVISYLGLNQYNSKDRVGNNLYLSIDHRLQTLGEKLLEGRNGAIVAIEPKTGKVLAMVSKPDFNPNNQKLSEGWQELAESLDHPFLARATKGLYAPGSTFKVVTSAGAVENGMDDEIFKDKGYTVIHGKKFTNAGGKAYGDIKLAKALEVSSNVVFSQVGVRLGSEKLVDISKRFGLGTKLPFDIPVSESFFPSSQLEKTEMAAASIGQGRVLVTPLQMAMVASAIANKGVMMKPMLVERITSPQGKNIENYQPQEFSRAISETTAQKVKEMMMKVVQSGTGTKASIQGIQVAGKTGTAENEMTGEQKNKHHTWFIGFAPANQPEIAIAVVFEYSGSSGGTLAAPVAKRMMETHLKNN